uniref:Uncharacterized protein n=1 Tax=Ligilactobacillus acidipiscis TaxID=89059 RepID=A0A2R8FG77_9LACO|nr:hypothetical protein PLAC02_P64 [Ligilactobacillus acidipiscis]
MLQKTINQSLVVMGLIFIIAMTINVFTPIAMFSSNAQIAYIAFFIVYAVVMYFKNSRQLKNVKS